MKINEKVFNGLVVGVAVVGSILVLGLAFGYVPAESRADVTKTVAGLVGAFAGLFVQKGE